MKILHRLKMIMNILILGLLLAGGGYWVASRYGVVPPIRSYVVMSGSMEPAIPVGSIVVSKPQTTYAIGDVITFRSGTGTETITHRIASINPGADEVSYTTRGDANEQTDIRPVIKSMVVGSTIASIPYLGYAVDFAKHPYGFILLVIVPATIVVYEELKTLMAELAKVLKRGTGSKQKEPAFDLVNVLSKKLPHETTTATESVTSPIAAMMKKAMDSPSGKQIDSLINTVKQSPTVSIHANNAPLAPETHAAHSPTVSLTLSLPTQQKSSPRAPKQIVAKGNSRSFAWKRWFPLVPILGSLTVFVALTGSYFSDAEQSLGNVLSAATSFDGTFVSMNYDAPISPLASTLETLGAVAVQLDEVEPAQASDAATLEPEPTLEPSQTPTPTIEQAESDT